MEKCSKHEALLKATSMINGQELVAPPTARLFIEPEPLEKIAVLTKAFKGFARALPLTKKAVEYMQGRALDYKLHEVGFISGSYHHDLSKEFTSASAKVGLLKPLATKGY